MTICAVNKIDSNVTGLSYAEEACLKILPSTSAAPPDLTDPVWRGLEPNSYGDFGGDSTSVARQPISASRQRKKGTITGFSATAAFNVDLTQTNLTRLLQGFFFNDAAEKPTTAPMNALALAMGAVATAGDTFGAASGLDVFLPGHIVKASGFIPANNGVHIISAAAADSVTVATNLTNEAVPAATAKLEAVGFRFGAGQVTLSVAATAVALTLVGAAVAWPDLDLQVGELVYVGGDVDATKFANNAGGFARITSITATVLTFDYVSWGAVASDGAGKTVEIYFGTVLKNGTKLRSYQFERTLGNDAVGPQAQYIEGSVANELTLNMPTEDKINVDLGFIGLNDATRTGAEGLKAGARVPAPGENAFNTSLDLHTVRMAIVDPTDIANDALFGFVSEATITIGNNASAVKALGHAGGFDVSVGNFDAGGSLTAYFSTVDAIRAIRNNADPSFTVIAAARNAGFAFDIPLLGVGGGRPNIELNSPVTIPLDASGAENKHGYSLLANWFSYLPNAAMPK